jgi:hypothetical protein
MRLDLARWIEKQMGCVLDENERLAFCGSDIGRE